MLMMKRSLTEASVGGHFLLGNECFSRQHLLTVSTWKSRGSVEHMLGKLQPQQPTPPQIKRGKDSPLKLRGSCDPEL